MQWDVRELGWDVRELGWGVRELGSPGTYRAFARVWTLWLTAGELWTFELFGTVSATRSGDDRDFLDLLTLTFVVTTFFGAGLGVGLLLRVGARRAVLNGRSFTLTRMV